MREIKFRAITTNANVNHFVYGLPVKAVKTGIWLMQIIEGEFGWLKTEGIDPETIGQFTGLHDKNGKEIYEGDRLRWVAYGWPMDEYKELSETRELVVKWVCGGFDVPYEDETESCYEVIGNIHEATK